MGPLLVPMVAAAALLAQSPPQQQETPVFRTETALVRVDVQVLDGHRPVSGLKAEDFVLRERGLPRKIDYFGREAEPIQVVLLLDVSGSMGKVLGEMASVGQKALANLDSDDRVAVALFARHARITQELTEEIPLALRALKEAPLDRDLGAGTSLNEAVLDVAAYLKQQPSFAGRRAVVVLTDGGGMHYRSPDEDVVRSLTDANAVLNAILPSGAKPPSEPQGGNSVNPDFTPANAFKLAEETGGEVMRADKAGARFQEMMERIRVRYSLGVKATPAPAGTFIPLQVDLSDEARRRYPKAEVHARAGYYAVGQ